MKIAVLETSSSSVVQKAFLTNQVISENVISVGAKKLRLEFLNSSSSISDHALALIEVAEHSNSSLEDIKSLRKTIAAGVPVVLLITSFSNKKDAAYWDHFCEEYDIFAWFEFASLVEDVDWQQLATKLSQLLLKSPESSRCSSPTSPRSHHHRSHSPLNDTRSLLSTSPNSICSLDSTFSLISAGSMHPPLDHSCSLIPVPHTPPTTIPGLHIRRSQSSDRAAVHAILVGASTFQESEIAAAMAVFDSFIHHLENHYLCFTATITTKETKITGWLAFVESDQGVYDLRCVAVDQAAQRCGVGSALMDYAERYICQQGGHLSTIAMPARGSAKSRFFCQKLGYSMEARITEFYRSGDDKLIFTKHFRAHKPTASHRDVDIRLHIPSTPATWKKEHQITQTEIEEAEAEDPALPQRLRGTEGVKSTPLPVAAFSCGGAVPSAGVSSPLPTASRLRVAFDSDESDESGHITDDSEPEPSSSQPHSHLHRPHHAHVTAPTTTQTPVAVSPRAPCYADVPTEMWNDYKWQMSHRLVSIENFEAAGIVLSPGEREAFLNPNHFPVAVTPYIASLMSPTDPSCPFRKQFIPTAQELKPDSTDLEDSLAEDSMSPVPGLVHRYPDRCLMLVSMTCAAYCRFCTRNRVVGGSKMSCAPPSGLVTEGNGIVARHQKQLDYIRHHTEIRDVLLSGGDPLLLPTSTLDMILSQLRAIPHVQIIRIGSRVPIVLPQRVQPELVNMLSKYHPLWMNVHSNHPNEITPESHRALGMLADAGIPLGNQSVLLAGVNDCPNVMKLLLHKLVVARVRPYYLYQCDEVKGAAHFRTPISKGMEIVEALRGHTSGFAIPTYIVDCPHGGGKVPLMPNYLVSQSDRRVVLRNYEGFMVAYDNPKKYHDHDSDHCKCCQDHITAENARRGDLPAEQSFDVSALLSGRGNFIAPEQWQLHHDYHLHERLKQKNQPVH